MTPHWHSGAAVLHSDGLRTSRALNGAKRFVSVGVDVVFVVMGSGHSSVDRVMSMPLTVTVVVDSTVAEGQAAGPVPPA